MSKINLGDRVKDSISGFQGIATSRTEFLTGCARISVSPEKLTSEGKPIEPLWFDEPSVLLVESGVHSIKSQETGGPRPDAQRKADHRAK